MTVITIRGGQTKPIDASGVAQGAGFNTVYATGTWSGGTLSVAVKRSPDTKAHTIPQTLTADGFFNFQAKYNQIILSLSGATTQSLTVDVL